MEHKSFQTSLELKKLSDSGEFEGYGSVFGNKDQGGDVVEPGAFTKSLVKWQEKNKFPALLWQHKSDEPIGVYKEIREDEHGLFVKGQLANTQLGKDAHELLKMDAISGLSIGYAVKDAEYNKNSNTFHLKELDLWEISLVTFPMNEEAQISAVKSFKKILQAGGMPSEREFEGLLKDFGFSQKESKTIITKGYKEIMELKNPCSQRDAVEQAKLLKTSLCNLLAERPNEEKKDERGI